MSFMFLARRFRYDWSTARSDLTAGATVAAIAVPQAIAYALIAGVDPRYGLYSAIIITIVASILGSSNHLINGPTNAISLVIFSALAPFDGRFDAYQALFLLGIIAGAIQITIAVFKLGDLTRYVSESVILGFMAGAGFLIALGQIGNFVGAAKRGSGDQSVLVNTWLTLSGGAFNARAIGLGVATIAIVLLLHKLIAKYKLPRVDMLVGLIVGSFAAASLGWSLPAASGKTIVAVVGTVPAALPSFHIPQIDFDWFQKLIRGALAIALLGLLEALAVAKSIATYTRQPLDYNRQCLTEGVGNLVGGFFQSLPGSGSLTRSAINYQSGAVTRAAGVYCGIIVAIVVLLLGPYARFVPKCVLAGLLSITAARLIDWQRLRYAIRASRFDAALVGVTACTAVFIDVEDSILVGVALSILLFVPRAAKPDIRELIVTPAVEYLETFLRDAEQRGITVLLAGVRPEFMKILSNVELTHWFPAIGSSLKKTRNFRPPCGRSATPPSLRRAAAARVPRCSPARFHRSTPTKPSRRTTSSRFSRSVTMPKPKRSRSGTRPGETAATIRNSVGNTFDFERRRAETLLSTDVRRMTCGE